MQTENLRSLSLLLCTHYQEVLRIYTFSFTMTRSNLQQLKWRENGRLFECGIIDAKGNNVTDYSVVPSVFTATLGVVCVYMCVGRGGESVEGREGNLKPFSQFLKSNSRQFPPVS